MNYLLLWFIFPTMQSQKHIYFCLEIPWMADAFEKGFLVLFLFVFSFYDCNGRFSKNRELSKSAPFTLIIPENFIQTRGVTFLSHKHTITQERNIGWRCLEFKNTSKSNISRFSFLVNATKES